MHVEADHAADTVHAANAEHAVEVVHGEAVHGEVAHTADIVHADDAEGAVKAVHTADTAQAESAEGTVKAVHVEAYHTADTVHADDVEGTVRAGHIGVEGAADTAHAANTEGAVEVVHSEVAHATDTVHAGNTECTVEAVHGETAHVGAEHMADKAYAGNTEDGVKVMHGKLEYMAHALGPEEKWLEEEIMRINWKRTKEKARKATQLQRRAEQPFPFPGLGYSPPHRTESSPRQPHSFPTPKVTTPTALATPTVVSAHATTDAGLHSVITAEDELLEDEYERICMVQAHALWAETRFTKYLTVDPLPHVDDPMMPTEVQGMATIQDVSVHQLHEAQQVKTQRRAAEAHWANTLRAVRLANTKVKARVATPGLSAAQARHRQDSADAVKWARHRQAEVVWRILQLEASDRGYETEGQARVFVESEIRIRQLREKPDEMKRMASEVSAQSADIHIIGEVSSTQFSIDRGTNKSMHVTDPFD
ncbi:hypothetical protein DFH08DRAFT_966678 [Mycena albidolilacea]|uniref:Uncharacterized protein n=1 Tax=Mycena albidolilacea TaxID=1033008 RepID=A0AAD7EK44_9AGAR|nr:hypothetical protein DFH08DRAFT_966678 [Mycena albidolilacea]